MLPPAKTAFVRRPNPNRTKDSICTRCFVTVATSASDAELDQAEQQHVCEPWRLERWQQMSGHDPTRE